MCVCVIRTLKNNREWTRTKKKLIKLEQSLKVIQNIFILFFFVFVVFVVRRFKNRNKIPFHFPFLVTPATKYKRPPSPSLSLSLSGRILTFISLTRHLIFSSLPLPLALIPVQLKLLMRNNIAMLEVWIKLLMCSYTDIHSIINDSINVCVSVTVYIIYIKFWLVTPQNTLLIIISYILSCVNRPTNFL